MRPRDLFQDKLSRTSHMLDDLHYIGEALPAPSLAMEVLAPGNSASIGNSAVPAREDHVHEIDVSELEELIEGLDLDVDLSGYYTSEEVDSLLTAYVTSTALATVLTDYYTATEVDSLIDGIVIPFEIMWSYGPDLNNDSPVSLNRYLVGRDISLEEIVMTVVTTSAEDHTVDLYLDDGVTPTVIQSITLPDGEFTHTEVFSPVQDVDDGEILYPILDDQASGDGTHLTIILRGYYR